MKKLFLLLTIVLFISLDANSSQNYRVATAGEILQEVVREYGKTWEEEKAEKERKEKMNIIIYISLAILIILVLLFVFKKILPVIIATSKKIQNSGINILNEKERNNAFDQIIKYKKLKDEGIISEEEFEEKSKVLKKKIL